MALAKNYPDDFEKLWKEYPKWPTGRSIKEPSYKTYAKVKRNLKFTAGDIEEIVADIEEKRRLCTTWQKGNQYGPPMFSKYFPVLTESLLISTAGGLIGLGTGLGLIELVTTLYPVVPAATPAWAIFSVLGVSLFTGVFFGVYPAIRAMRLDPIVALAGRG